MKGWIIGLSIPQVLLSGLGTFGLMMSILASLSSGVPTSIPLVFLFIGMGVFLGIFLSGIIALIKLGNKFSLISNFLLGVPILLIGLRISFLSLKNGPSEAQGAAIFSSLIVVILGTSMLASAVIMTRWRKREQYTKAEAHFE